MSDRKFYGRHTKYYAEFSTQHSRHERFNSSDEHHGYKRQMFSDVRSSTSFVTWSNNALQNSRCLGIFGMSSKTTEETLFRLFSKFGPIERIQMVNFTHTYISRGFGFIYFDKIRDAYMAKKINSGLEVDGRHIRVDFAISQREYTPTPGVYQGRPSRPRRNVSRDRDTRSRTTQHYSTRRTYRYPTRYREDERRYNIYT